MHDDRIENQEYSGVFNHHYSIQQLLAANEHFKTKTLEEKYRIPVV